MKKFAGFSRTLAYKKICVLGKAALLNMLVWERGFSTISESISNLYDGISETPFNL